MRFSLAVVLVLGLVVAGCGSEPDFAEAAYGPEALDNAADADAAPESQFGFMEASEPARPFGRTGESAEQAAMEVRPAVASTAPDTDQPPVDNAQIAYSYGYGYRVDAGRIGELQQSHAALCEKMGPHRCRVLDLSRAGTGDDGYGGLELRVAADEARGFGTALDKAAEAVGGKQVSFGVRGEDLSETIVDTEAHLASQRVLRERLMEVLRTRQGSVGDLIEAERAVAAVNEDIDSAASQLANLRGRVRMSAVSIEYGPNIAVDSLGFSRPITTALGSVGTTLGVTIAAMIYAIVALVPLIAVVLLLRWLWRKSGIRIRREKAGREKG